MATKCKRLFAGLLMLLVMNVAYAVEKPTKIYVYGFSASFNDSTVYLTDIMELDSAWINVKTKFLYGRESYSYQLKNYLQEKGVETPTCIVSYALKRKDAEKKYLKLKKRYTEGKDVNYLVKFIAANDFKFELVSAAYDNEATAKKDKKAAKAEKKAKKEQMKASGMQKPPRQPGGPEGNPGGGPGGGPGGMR